MDVSVDSQTSLSKEPCIRFNAQPEQALTLRIVGTNRPLILVECFWFLSAEAWAQFLDDPSQGDDTNASSPLRLMSELFISIWWCMNAFDSMGIFSSLA